MSARAPVVVAIDGPAASGKGTLARRLAATLGLRHLDTGLTYRAVAQAMLQAGLPLDNEELAAEVARHIELAGLDREALSSHEIGEAASRVAVMSAVREALVAAQRDFAVAPPGAVLDGRDIGTVVCPHATAKLFVTASAQIRAGRRFEETSRAGSELTFEQVLDDIQRRDERDMQRADSPLKPAADAHLIDTSEMDIETAFRTALAIVEHEIEEARGA